MEPTWRVEMLGWLPVVGADRTISRFQTQTTGALLAYHAFYCHLMPFHVR